MKNLKEYILTENNFFKNLGIGNVTLIKKWLEKNKIKDYEYTINNDYTIDVMGSVKIFGYEEDELPDYIQFRIVSEEFLVEQSKIKSFRGFPTRCDALYFFNCNEMENLKGLETDYKKITINGCKKLSSLKGLSDTVSSISLYGCSKITSEELKNIPTKNLDKFTCSGCNKVTTLSYMNIDKDKVFDYFSCSNSTKLKDLVGSPTHCNEFCCSYCNGLTDLTGAPQECEEFNCSCCKNLTSLKGVSKCKILYCSNCKNLSSLDGLQRGIKEIYRMGSPGIAKIDLFDYFKNI